MKEYVIFVDKETQSTAEASLIDGFVPELKGPQYFFNRLYSRYPGKGGGTKVLKELLAFIDLAGIPLINQVNAYGGLSQKELEGFYKKFGFVQVHKKFKDELLVYYPKGYIKALAENLNGLVIMLRGGLKPLIAKERRVRK